MSEDVIVEERRGHVTGSLPDDAVPKREQIPRMLARTMLRRALADVQSSSNPKETPA